MKTWKFRPNTYDVNLVKGHDDNSAINTKSRIEQQLEAVRSLPRAKQKFVSEFLETVLQAS